MNDQITACTVSPDQKSLITGSKDGKVSIWNVENNFELREEIDVFYEEETWKHFPVSEVCVHPISLGLFASSANGNMKLLRF